ncbi:MAG: Lrp/AsnC family transcriptional regulator, partial [Candidatus Nanohaloarchaea archaeon]
RELADELDLSPSTVSNRFHRLQEDGIIERFVPIIDHEAAGFGLTALIEMTAETAKMEEVVADLRARDRVTSFYEVTGESDMVLVCKFVDREDMNRCVKEFQKVDGVLSTQTKVVMTTPTEHGDVDLRAARED